MEPTLLTFPRRCRIITLPAARHARKTDRALVSIRRCQSATVRSADRFEPQSLRSFRQAYPKGRNFLVAQDVARTHARRFGAVEVTLTSLEALPELLQES